MPRSNFCYLIVCLVLTVACALAQDRGSITGFVTDSSGAAIPAAEVTLQNRATGLKQAARTSVDGTYTFLYLNAGTYTLTVEKEGFRPVESTGARVNVNTTTRVDMQLQVGTVLQTLEVSAAATLLQTETSDLGRIVDNEAIQMLPLFIQGGLRSNLSFAVLTPGVNLSTTSDPDTSGMRVSGGVNNGNSMLVDGSEAMSERRNDPAMRVVSSEGIEEFKVHSSAYSAEFGRTSNGVLNYTTKSGTNELHLSAFGAIRNEHLNANGFSYTANPLKTIHRQNLEAVGLGGPVFIPKVFDGRNKLFFYFSGERSRAKDAGGGLNQAQDTVTGLITLPIEEFRKGDFRKLATANGTPIPLYEPFDQSGNIIPAGSQRQRLHCNGVLNVICQERIDPMAAYIQSFLPLPDNPGAIYSNTYSRTNGNRVPGAMQGVYSIKMDYNPTANLRFNGLFSRQYFDSYPLKGPVPGGLGSAWQESGTSKWLRTNVDYIFRPTLLNHFMFGYNQRDLAEQAYPDKMGLPPEYRERTLIPGIPETSTSVVKNVTEYQFADWGNFGLGSFVSTKSPSRTYSIGDQVAWLKGRHNLRMGFEYMKVSYKRYSCNRCAGNVSFAASATGNPSVSGVTGYSHASFLLGLATSGSFFYAAAIENIYRYWGFYLQDDIKLTNKLTLNVGVRYDLPFPKVERDRQNSNFNPSIPNTGAGGLLGALEFAGEGPGRSGRDSLQFLRKNAIGPRLGLAYQITPSTVVRAGGAIMYDSNREDNNADNGIQGFGGGFSAPSNYVSDGISFTLADGFNTFASMVDAGKPVRIDPTLANFTSPNYKAGESGRVAYFTDYNFTLEHSFGANTLLRASFHANYGQKLQQSLNVNQLDPKYLAVYGSLLTTPLSSAINNPKVIASGFTLPYEGYPLNQQLQQALRPFPHYVGNINGTSAGGHSTYNALETSFQHRFSKGVFITASYTFSKMISSATSSNVYARNTEKAISSADRPHIFVLSYIYELPFGQGKPLLSRMHPVLNGILGNWTVAAVHRYQSGTPISVSASQNMYGAGSSTASFVQGEPLLNPEWDPKDPTSPYINRAAFFQPANAVYGDTPAVIAQLRQANQLNEDIALSKTFLLGSESRRLEFRGSAFNVANRHLMGNLVTNVSSTTFGRFNNPQSNQPRSIEFSLRLSF